MNEAGSCQFFGEILHCGLVHDLQTGTVCKGQKVGSEASVFVVVHLVGNGIKIPDEECSCPLQIGYIHGDVFNSHCNYPFFRVFSVTTVASRTPTHSTSRTNGVMAKVVAVARKPKTS